VVVCVCGRVAGAGVVGVWCVWAGSVQGGEGVCRCAGVCVCVCGVQCVCVQCVCAKVAEVTGASYLRVYNACAVARVCAWWRCARVARRARCVW